MYHSSIRSARETSGKTVLALVATLSLLLSLFVVAAPVVAQGGVGEADCPEGTTFLINYNQADIDVGDELVAGVVVTAITEHDGELASVTIQNDTDANVTIAVKGGSDQVGNSVTIASGASATISVTDNPTISNLSVCEGPEGDQSPTLTVAKVTVGGDDEFQLTLDGTNAASLSNGESDEVATAAGDYDLAEVLSEAQVTAGWSVTAIECTGNAAAETASVTAGTVAVTVGADEDVVCTFTNTLDTPAEGAPDVLVEKSAEVDGQPITSVEIGGSYDYVLTVTNVGDATAIGVHLEDNLDDELTIDGISASQGTCSVTDAENRHIGCDLGDLDAGASATVTVSVTATLGDPNGGTGNPICRSPVDNVAEVSADNESDEAEGNNDSNEVVVVIDCGDVGSLKVSKVDEEGNGLPGAVFTVEGQEGTFTTGEDGTFCITGLPFGAVLTVTETQAPTGFEIVGSGTAEVTVDPDGDCDSPEAIFVNTPDSGEAEDETGTLEIRKTTNPSNAVESFAFTATFGAPEGFALSGGGVLAATVLPAGDYSVQELLTSDQTAAGWSLAAITCTADGDAVVNLASAMVTVTIDDGDEVVCTFENAQERGGEQPGVGGPGQSETPREGTQGGNPLPNTATSPIPTGSPPAVLLALLLLAGLGGAGYAATAEARRRR
ncbi:MAG TPA: SpaA isopeptide-forming pilin-related protein [Candidatus Limnocylindria bacterium]